MDLDLTDFLIGWMAVDSLLPNSESKDKKDTQEMGEGISSITYNTKQ